jgi:hypothetical protein
MRDIASRAAGEEAMKNPLMNQLQYDDDGIAAMFLSAGQSSRIARAGLRNLHYRNGVWDDGWNDARIDRAVAMAESVGINQRNFIASGTLGAQNKFRSLGYGPAANEIIRSTIDRAAGVVRQNGRIIAAS